MLNRKAVLDAIIREWPDAEFTTADLAAVMGAHERPVRGAVTWLAAGRLLDRVGTVPRVDRKNRPYRAQVYRWTGRTQIQRVPHDIDDRRHSLEITDATRFLSMRW